MLSEFREEGKGQKPPGRDTPTSPHPCKRRCLCPYTSTQPAYFITQHAYLRKTEPFVAISLGWQMIPLTFPLSGESFKNITWCLQHLFLLWHVENRASQLSCRHLTLYNETKDHKNNHILYLHTLVHSIQRLLFTLTVSSAPHHKLDEKCYPYSCAYRKLSISKIVVTIDSMHMNGWKDTRVGNGCLNFHTESYSYEVIEFKFLPELLTLDFVYTNWQMFKAEMWLMEMSNSKAYD